jgi:hypothetical protein
MATLARDKSAPIVPMTAVSPAFVRRNKHGRASNYIVRQNKQAPGGAA